MKKNFRGMTLAAMLLSASTSVQADNNDSVYGNSNSFVGDMSATVPDQTSGPVAPVTNYAPVTIGDLQPAAGSTASDGLHQQTSFLGGGHSSSTCDGGCDGGCDGMSCSGGKITRGLNLGSKDGWLRAEALIMFMQERRSPILVSDSDTGTFPALTDARFPLTNTPAGIPVDTSTTRALFGGELDGGVSGGFRGDFGSYLSSNIGVGGRITWIGENGDDYSLSGNGSGRSIGRPYFFAPGAGGAGISQEDALLVNLEDGANSISGSVDADFATEIFGAEAYARLRMCDSKRCRLEFLGGYSYWGLDDEVNISSTSIRSPNGNIDTFSSRFDAENRFNGGQIGFESVLNRGRWSARMLSKIHLGNMERTVDISGSTTSGIAGGPAPTTTNSSLLVAEDQGVVSDDVFTFIPEMNFTLGYRFRDHVSFTVGYNFMYFDSVALAGEQINRIRDTNNLGASVTPAGFAIQDGSLWVQGISLGASVDF